MMMNMCDVAGLASIGICFTVASMRRNVQAFLALDLSDDAKRRILFDNAAALLG